MAITINGSANTVAGLAAGGLPDNTVDGGNLAMGSDAAGDVLYYNGTDYIRLAKGTDGQVLTLASGVPTWAAAAATGLNEADQWRITSGQSIPANTDTVLASNWERVDTNAQGKLGTGLTESSGVFTFPSTGVWHVSFNAMVEESSDCERAGTYISLTENNGTNWSTVVEGLGSVNATGTAYQVPHCNSLVDVTDASNVKVRFMGNASDATVFDGSSSSSRTYVTFIRYGDT
tara:strand:- start:333 stop:1028 length:696 start_codon:yes stop_codon:yes gene_type:complete